MWMGIIRYTEGLKREKRQRKGKFILFSAFLPAWAGTLVSFHLGLRFRLSAPLVLRPMDSEWIIPLTFPGILLADGRSWDFLTSIIVWANSLKEISLCLSLALSVDTSCLLIYIKKKIPRSAAEGLWANQLLCSCPWKLDPQFIEPRIYMHCLILVTFPLDLNLPCFHSLVCIRNTGRKNRCEDTGTCWTKCQHAIFTSWAQPLLCVNHISLPSPSGTVEELVPAAEGGSPTQGIDFS